MNRPAPRKSSLAGTSPLTPPAAAPEQPAPAAAGAPPAQSKVPATQGKGTRRMNYYTDKDQADRIRTAYIVGRSRYGWRNLTDFQLDTIMKRVTELEAELNGGHPFEPSPAGTVSAGRPIE